MRRWIFLFFFALWVAAMPAHAAKLIIEGESYTVSKGGILVTYVNPIVTLGSAKLHAKSLVYNKDTKEIHVSGNIVVTSKKTLLTAESGEFEAKDGKILLHNATLFDQKNNAFVTAKKIERISEDEFLVEEATVTLCDPNKKSWSFYSTSIYYQVENFAYSTNMLFYVYDVPVFYAPVFSWPTTTKRTSGVLPPSFASQVNTGDPSRNYGSWLRVPVFWAIDEDQDATFQLDFLPKRGTGLGLDYNYAFIKGMKGEFSGWDIEEKLHQRVAAYEDFGGLAIDPATGFPFGMSPSPTRYQYSWKHRQNFWEGQIFAEHLQRSDNEIEKEYFESTNDFEVRRFSKLGVEYPWESGGISLQARRQDTFLVQSIYDTSTDWQTALQVKPAVNVVQNWHQVAGSNLSVIGRAELSTYERIYGWSGQQNQAELEMLYPVTIDFLRIKPSIKAKQVSLASSYAYDPLALVDGAFATNPDQASYVVGAFQMTTDFEVYRVFKNLAGQNKSRLSIRPSWEVDLVSDQDQRASLGLVPFGTVLAGTQADYSLLASTLPEKFDTLSYAKNLHTLGMEMVYHQKEGSGKKINEKVRLKLSQRINLNRKNSLAEIEASFQGPQVVESLQETSLGNTMMPLLLDLTYQPLEGVSGELFYRYGHEEGRMLEQKIDLIVENNFGDALSLGYHNNSKAYADLDGVTLRNARKEFSVSSNLQLSENLKFDLTAHWNLARDAAYLYSAGSNRIGRALTASTMSFTYRYDCFDFYLSYGEELYNWQIAAVEYEGLEKRVVFTVNLVGLSTGTEGYQTQWSKYE